MTDDGWGTENRTNPDDSGQSQGRTGRQRRAEQRQSQEQPTEQDNPGRRTQRSQPNQRRQAGASNQRTQHGESKQRGGRNRSPQHGQPRQGGSSGGPGKGGPSGQTQPGQAPGQGPPGGYPQQSDGIDFGSLPWISGAINGVAYFVSAFIIASMVFIGDIIMTFDSFDPGSDFFRYGLGWKYYAGHFVDVPQDFSTLHNQLAIPEIGYTVIPAVFLFLAGRSVARTHAREGMTNLELAAHGATVSVGYLVMAVLGVVMLENNGAGPDMGTAVLLMGLAFPIVCGGLGGYLARR